MFKPLVPPSPISMLHPQAQEVTQQTTSSFLRKLSGSRGRQSGSAASGLVTVKVVLLQQVAKGAKIVPVVVDAVCWFLIEGY